MESFNLLFDSCGFLFECFLPRRKKEHELGGRKCFGPIVDVVGVVEDFTPDGVKEGRQLATGRFGTVAKEDDLRFK